MTNIGNRPPLGIKQAKTKNGTSAGLKYMRQVKQLPCVICNAPPPSDAHHVFHDRFGQGKASDFATIPLCKAHHQIGPDAIHVNKRQWRERYGPDYGYLQQVKDMLGL